MTGSPNERVSIEERIEQIVGYIAELFIAIAADIATQAGPHSESWRPSPFKRTGGNEVTDLWLTPKEAARYAKVTAKTIIRAIGKGHLTAARPSGKRPSGRPCGRGGNIRLRKEWIDAWIEGRPAPRRSRDD